VIGTTDLHRHLLSWDCYQDRAVVDETGAAHTLRIGVIAVEPPPIMLWDRQHLAGRVEVLDIVDPLRRAAPRLGAAGEAGAPRGRRLRDLRDRSLISLPGRSRGGVVIGSLLLVLGAVALVGALLLGLLLAWYALDLPPLDEATEYRPRQHLVVLAGDGTEIAQFGSERRVFVPVAQMPQALKDAVIATEDAGFYGHHGISWRGVARATLANLSGGVPQGASTITQQVARTMFLSTRRTVERKLKEALIARRLEAALTKDQILELYLNQVYVGTRAYGMGAAAETYFGKPLQQLNLAELALIAGLPQNPIYANPFANEAAAVRRQRWVLQRMLRSGKISQAEHDAAVARKLVYRRTRGPEVAAQHVGEMARRAVFEQLGERAYTEGIRVVTSLHADEQRAAHAALRKALLAHERRQSWRGPEEQEELPADPEAAERAAALALRDVRDDDDLRAGIVMAASERALQVKLASGETVTVSGEGLRLVRAALRPQAPAARAVRRGAVLRLQAAPGPGGTPTWSVAQWPEADGAYVALDPATGRVRALVGGFSFSRGPFNRATQARRQPGSSFKPFLYATAFEHGVMPETVVDDLPLQATDGGAPNWNPGNSDGAFDGPMTVRDGLVRSKNLVSIRVLHRIGLAAARDGIARFGFDMNRQPSDLTLALGTGSVTPLEMAAAYGVFANGGHRVAPVLIERIVAADGSVLFEAPPAPPLDGATRVLPARTVFLANSLLQDVTARGTAARAQATLQRPDLYGKTGTTNDAVDAWFAGWAPGVVGVGWIGHDEPRSLGERETGGGLALPVWIDAMARALRGVPVQPLEPPEGVLRVGGDWRYTEFADGGFIRAIGNVAEATTPTAAGAPAPAASR
jgi:penicillin-binding protein 1A